MAEKKIFREHIQVEISGEKKTISVEIIEIIEITFVISLKRQSCS